MTAPTTFGTIGSMFVFHKLAPVAATVSMILDLTGAVLNILASIHWSLYCCTPWRVRNHLLKSHALWDRIRETIFDRKEASSMVIVYPESEDQSAEKENDVAK